MINVACELSQPMGKTEFSSTAKNRTLPHSYTVRNSVPSGPVTLKKTLK